MKRKLLPICVFAAVVAIHAFGCDEVDERIDCGQVCQAYDRCVEDIDGTTCADSCEDALDRGDLDEEAVDFCEECVERMQCSEQEPCWDATAGECAVVRAWIRATGFPE
ncbi:MAG: hypothetical protein ACOCV4_05730 [Myxococcota bacterium]